MRILHLITRMDGGGSAVNTLLSATAQQRAGRHVCLAFGLSDESEMSATERRQLAGRMQAFREVGGETVILLSLVRRPGWFDFAACRQIRQLIARGFDVVHTHTSKAGALGRLAAWGRARAVVHTPHGHAFHSYFGKLGTQLVIGIERFLAHRCNALVALTPQERDEHLALKIGNKSQWHVIHSGVDVEAIASQAGHMDVDKKWRAVSVGRLAPIKGMDRLVRAWREVVNQDTDARLAIVGDGSELPGLRSLADSLGIGRNVHFAGWSDPLPYLQAAGCFVLLSRNEGMGRAVVEAMAAGLPCVTADVCGLRELVDASVGTRVQADNPQEVAEALLRNWPSSVSDAARERARSYSVEAMVNKLLQLYERLLNDA